MQFIHSTKGEKTSDGRNVPIALSKGGYVGIVRPLEIFAAIFKRQRPSQKMSLVESFLVAISLWRPNRANDVTADLPTFSHDLV